MKKLYLCLQLFLTLCALSVRAGVNDFVTTWDLSKGGGGTNDQISFIIGVANSGTSYSWETVPSGTSGGPVAMPTSGATIVVSGLPTNATIRLTIVSTNLRSFKMEGSTNVARLTDVNQWGNASWNTMSGAFYGCSNLTVSATDAPTLTGVSTMNNMFRGCSSLTGIPGINTWNTSTATNMNAMFREATLFNSDIGDWNTANVTTLEYMFREAAAFNQDIGEWNVAKVTTMRGMVQSASAFNQNLGSWSLTAVTTPNTLVDMFTSSGMDCAHYSATLIGWADNVNTPNSLTLGATGRTYGTNAATARATLTGKSWTISGDAAGGSACTLPTFPVTLISFSAREAEDGAALRWETTSEVGASHFEIERSADAKNFTKMGRVEALGNSSKLHGYTFSDDLSGYLAPVVYYRLRSIDLDETFSLSRVIALQRKQEFVSLGVFPNPAPNGGKVTVETSASLMQVSIFDLSGRKISFPSAHPANGRAELDLKGLTSGLYIIQLDSARGLAKRKLVVN